MAISFSDNYKLAPGTYSDLRAQLAHYGNRLYSSYDLMMVVYEAWLRDELVWVKRGRLWCKPGDMRWTMVYQYAMSRFWRVAQRYLEEVGHTLWLIRIGAWESEESEKES